MMALDYNKHKVDLSKRGCIPAANFNGRWSCDYGNNGISIAKHNYYTKNGALITVFDVYVKGVYEVTFNTKKSALEYAECRENGFNMKKKGLL